MSFDEYEEMMAERVRESKAREFFNNFDQHWRESRQAVRRTIEKIKQQERERMERKFRGRTWPDYTPEGSAADGR